MNHTAAGLLRARISWARVIDRQLLQRQLLDFG